VWRHQDHFADEPVDFVESIEDAVRREVMEEAGVKVGQVR
jgi:8-oxo-dGTP pyrophosphatase MutT (NUDIX family)